MRPETAARTDQALSAIRLIVGLGNPGGQYEGTRHNAGAFFVRRLATQFGLTLTADRNALGESARGTIAGHDLRLLIPETFMNESGRSVAAMARYYRIEPDAILIAHDELDIPPGESRFKYDGGHGGHNGLRDIIPALSGRRDFWRLRIGIGHPGSAKQVSSWVLSKASAADQIAIEASTEAAIGALPLLLDGEDIKAMTALHSESYAATPPQED